MSSYEQDMDIVSHFRTKTDINCAEGDATNDELLLKCGIKSAKALITISLLMQITCL